MGQIRILWKEIICKKREKEKNIMPSITQLPYSSKIGEFKFEFNLSNVH